MRARAFVAVLSILSLSASAADVSQAPASVAKDAPNRAAIQKNLVKLNLGDGEISKSPINDLYQVITDHGLFYFSQDGNFVIRGNMYDLSGQSIENMTENALAKVRVEGIKQFEDSMIVFPAKDEKYKVTVFTDTNCGYCRKLHSQIDKYNDLGITVRYLAFPRSGIGGSTYKQMQAIWCSDDKQKAMTEAKSGAHPDLSKVKDCKAPVAEEYALGVKVGVSGTPAIILDDGTMIAGYQGPAQLLQTLIASN